MAKEKSKTPRVDPGIAASGLGSKVPKASAPSGGYDACTPAWCFSHMDRSGPFGWTNLTPEDSHEVFGWLFNVGAKTWREVVRDSNKHNHAIEAYKLSKAAKDRLEAMKPDDVDAVVSLRLGAKKRVWVARVDHYAFLLWWDPEHQVYPTEPRNT